jgi:uncharacterized coiled-coil protein SlyX
MREAMNFTVKVKAKEVVAILQTIAAKLASIEARISTLEEKVMSEQTVVAELAQVVGEQGTVIESAMALIDGLVAAVGGATDVSPEVQAIIDQVKAQRDALAQKVVDNTAAAQPGGVQPV